MCVCVCVSVCVCLCVCVWCVCVCTGGEEQLGEMQEELPNTALNPGQSSRPDEGRPCTSSG